MDRWAQQYGDECTFVVACCDGMQLAQTFASELKLQHVLNVWCDPRSMPRWGQLGCQGFIVGDGRHSVVCKRTVAFMEVREIAFRHCETLVDALIGKDSAPSLASLATLHPGAIVRLHSLSAKPELNGRETRKCFNQALRRRLVLIGDSITESWKCAAPARVWPWKRSLSLLPLFCV